MGLESIIRDVRLAMSTSSIILINRGAKHNLGQSVSLYQGGARQVNYSISQVNVLKLLISVSHTISLPSSAYLSRAHYCTIGDKHTIVSGDFASSSSFGMRVGTWGAMTDGASSMTVTSPSRVDTFSSTSLQLRDSMRMGSSCRGRGRK